MSAPALWQLVANGKPLTIVYTTEPEAKDRCTRHDVPGVFDYTYRPLYAEPAAAVDALRAVAELAPSALIAPESVDAKIETTSKVVDLMDALKKSLAAAIKPVHVVHAVHPMSITMPLCRADVPEAGESYSLVSWPDGVTCPRCILIVGSFVTPAPKPDPATVVAYDYEKGESYLCPACWAFAVDNYDGADDATPSGPEDWHGDDTPLDAEAFRLIAKGCENGTLECCGHLVERAHQVRTEETFGE